MNATDNLASHLEKLRRLAPYALVAGALLGALAMLLVVLGVLDLIRSAKEMHSRFIYSILTFLGLSSSLGIAAYYSINAWHKLRRLTTVQNGQAFGNAIDSLVSSHRAFYLWLGLLLVLVIISIFLPAYSY